MAQLSQQAWQVIGLGLAATQAISGTYITLWPQEASSVALGTSSNSPGAASNAIESYLGQIGVNQLTSAAVIAVLTREEQWSALAAVVWGLSASRASIAWGAYKRGLTAGATWNAVASGLLVWIGFGLRSIQSVSKTGFNVGATVPNVAYST